MVLFQPEKPLRRLFSFALMKPADLLAEFLRAPERPPGSYLMPRLPPDSVLVTEEIHGCPTDFLITQKYDTDKKSFLVTVTTVLPAVSVQVDHLAVSPPPRYPWENL